MKTALVALKLDEEQRDFLIRQTAGGTEEVRFIFKEADLLTQQDLENVDWIIGAVDPQLAAAAKKLEWLQLSSAGADIYVKPGILQEHVLLTNSSGAYGLTVSEHMVAVTFALIRRLHQYARNQSRHEWKMMGPVISVEGAVVLVLGLGDIGGSYARKMKALGAYVIGVRRTKCRKPEYVDEQYTLEELDRLLPRADIVAMVLPGGEATKHLMDERRLRLMKKGAFLINDGRGNAIDPAGLKNVLKDGHLGGAALDVTEPEPLPADDELWDDENVIVTPHISGQFLLKETLVRVLSICGRNLYHRTHGEEMEHVVDRGTGY